MLHLIPQDILARLRLRQALIEQYRLLLSDLEAATVGDMAGLGLDMDAGDWELDLGRGILTRKDAPDGNPATPSA